jgi:hypothetical protein
MTTIDKQVRENEAIIAGVTQYSCGDCDWKGPEERMAPIDDVHSRVGTGELMAPGCCPKCGSLIGVMDRDVPDYTIEACVKIARERGLL